MGFDRRIADGISWLRWKHDSKKIQFHSKSFLSLYVHSSPFPSSPQNPGPSPESELSGSFLESELPVTDEGGVANAVENIGNVENVDRQIGRHKAHIRSAAGISDADGIVGTFSFSTRS